VFVLSSKPGGGASMIPGGTTPPAKQSEIASTMLNGMIGDMDGGMLEDGDYAQIGIHTNEKFVDSPSIIKNTITPLTIKGSFDLNNTNVSQSHQNLNPKQLDR
jgi:allophanate hydrolase subunit 2